MYNLYVCMSGVWLGVLGWARNALLFFPLQIMGNLSSYMFFAVKPIFWNDLGVDNKVSLCVNTTPKNKYDDLN